MLQIPEGQACGCLPRITKVGDVCPLFGERIDIIEREEWFDRIADDITMRRFIQHIFSQGNVGSCAWESLAQGVASTVCFRTGVYPLFNPWSGYAYVANGKDNGSSIDENLEFARDDRRFPGRLFF